MAVTDAALLKKIPLFAQLADEECRELADLLETRTYKANEPIFWIGDEGSDFLVVQHGHVMLALPDEDGRETQLAVLGPGSFFGELSLLDGGPRTASARAKGDLTLLSLGREQFSRFLKTTPAAAMHIIAILGQRNRHMLDLLRGVKNVNEAVEEHTTPWQHVADRVAQLVASPVFIVLQLAIIFVWVCLNELRGANAFDVYPYCLLSLVVSSEALFLSTFVLISQNRQSQRDRIRADLDYQVNTKAHMEVMELHQKIDRLQAMLGARGGDDQAVAETAAPADGQATGR